MLAWTIQCQCEAIKQDGIIAAAPAGETSLVQKLVARA